MLIPDHDQSEKDISGIFIHSQLCEISGEVLSSSPLKERWKTSKLSLLLFSPFFSQFLRSFFYYLFLLLHFYSGKPLLTIHHDS